MSRLSIILAAALVAGPALAQETIKVAVGSGGNLEAFIAEMGQKAGFFEKQGMKLDVFYTAGGGETLQAVLSQSAPIGVSLGSSGTLGAFAKGAPIRVIGASAIGSPVYWYVRADSPIRRMEDINGKTMAYSTTGSGSHAVALLVRARSIDAKLVATGNTPATFTQVMTGQIDVGMAYPEFKPEALTSGQIRFLFRDNDFDRIRDQAVRVIATHKSVPLDLAQRFMRAYAQTVDWIYSGDAKALEHYAELAKVDVATARKMRDELWSRAILSVEKIKGLDIIMQDAMEGKFIAKPLTQAEIEDLIAPWARP
jgi:NitT/TauT family transport system substrate-binding protein